MKAISSKSKQHFHSILRLKSVAKKRRNAYKSSLYHNLGKIIITIVSNMLIFYPKNIELFFPNMYNSECKKFSENNKKEGANN